MAIISKSVAVAHALSCKGWTSSDKLSKLFELVQETESLSGDILEIGSAWGRSTVLLGLSSKKRIWSIDPHTGGLAYLRKGKNQDSYEEFIHNLKEYGILERVVILKKTTQEVLEHRLIPDSIRFSLIFIDGLHTAAGVLGDFTLAFEQLMHNGAMIFDDYFEPGIKDYAKMIDKLSEENKLMLQKDNFSGLVFCYKNF